MLALVITFSSSNATNAPHRTTRRHSCHSSLCVTRRVFGGRWRAAWCIAYYESRSTLGARNGANLGPWQINVVAHPWANPWLLTHSWVYSARAARRISRGGTDWSPWTTASLC